MTIVYHIRTAVDEGSSSRNLGEYAVSARSDLRSTANFAPPPTSPRRPMARGALVRLQGRDGYRTSDKLPSLACHASASITGCVRKSLLRLRPSACLTRDHRLGAACRGSEAGEPTGANCGLVSPERSEPRSGRYAGCEQVGRRPRFRAARREQKPRRRANMV